jgi:SLT domain-containing protein
MLASTAEQKTAEETKKQLRQSRFERKNQSETFHKQSDLIQRQLHDLHISNEQAQRKAAEQIIELVQGGKKANATLQQTLQMLKHVQS